MKSDLEPNPPRDIIQAIKKAEKFVKSQYLFKEFIDGTPLTNDIAVWLADFYMQGYQEWKSVKGDNQDFIAGLQSAYHTISTARTPHDADNQDDYIAISERRACMREIKAQIDASRTKVGVPDNNTPPLSQHLKQ
jgi:hypothetical protein